MMQIPNSSKSQSQKESTILQSLASKYAKMTHGSNTDFHRIDSANPQNNFRQFLLEMKITEPKELEFLDKTLSKLSFKSQDFELMFSLRLKIKRLLQSNNQDQFLQDYHWRYQPTDSSRWVRLIPAYFNSLPPNATIERELSKFELMNPVFLLKIIDLENFKTNTKILAWIEFVLREWIGQLAIANKTVSEGASNDDALTYRRKLVF
jgi:hypothetical protein